MKQERTQVIDAIVIFFGSLILFTVSIAAEEIISFESRFYLFALEMWRHGPSWFPMTYHQPYPDYPGTSSFIIYLFSKMLGGLNKFTAVLPTAIASALTLATTYSIGALHSRRWGVSAALFLLFTAAFIFEARSISLDQYTTTFTTLCFYLIYSAKMLQKPQRMLWIFPILVMSFAIRGPLGLVIPAGVVCIFYLLDRDFKKLFTVASVAALLLVICSAVLLAIAYHVGGTDFLHAVLKMEVFGRMQNVHTPPVYYYFMDSFGAYAISYPLAILVLLGILPRMGASSEGKLLRQLLGWVLVLMIGLSIPGDKKIRYILPMAPALALICGYLLITAREQRYFKVLRNIFYWFCFFLPAVFLVIVMSTRAHHPEWNFSYHVAVSLLVIMQLMIFLVRRRGVLVLLFATLAFVTTNICVVEKINIDLNRTRSFVREVESLRVEKQAQLVFYHEGKDGLVIKYLADMAQEADPVFIMNAEELLPYKDKAIYVTTQENYQQIPEDIAQSLQIVREGKIGHVSVVVFVKNV